MDKTVVELFAGVGGFRVGLNDVKLSSDGKAIEKSNFKFVWANQWEPSTKTQDAFYCYKKRFSKDDGSDDYEFSNVNIMEVNKNNIPDFTLLTGGFPCQDYSVARSLSNEKGIEGKKGVLWWQINEILKAKKPPFVLLENVDRLIKSPSKQRGRDFGIMLRCFNDNDYTVEWRVINAAEYGMPQRRRRVYIFAYKNNTNLAEKEIITSPKDILIKDGLFSSQFKVQQEINISETRIDKKVYSDLVKITENFNFHFENAGFMRNGHVYTGKVLPILEDFYRLGDIIIDKKVDNKYFLNNEQILKFQYLKFSKKIERISKAGHRYNYSEGSMSYPDSYDNPGRTMLTSEGTVNRSTHIVVDKLTKRYRFLTPIECERLNQFPDNWTDTMSEKRRYFMMGNALVTGVIKIIGNKISDYIDQEI